jgi:hypothetical protein
MKTKNGDARPPMELTEGQRYYIRTARNDYIGVLESVLGPYTVVLRDAVWVADSGRLHAFMRDGKTPNMEIEALGASRVMAQWLDIAEWPHEIPETT